MFMTRFYPVILFVAITSSGCALQTMQNHAVAVYPYFGSEFLKETDNLNVGPLFREYEIGYIFQDRMLKNWLTGGIDTSAMASTDAQVSIVRNGDLQRIILFNPDQPVARAAIAPTREAAGQARLARLQAHYDAEKNNMSLKEREIYLSSMESQMQINQATEQMNATLNFANAVADVGLTIAVAREQAWGTASLKETINETHALDAKKGKFQKATFLLYDIAAEGEVGSALAFTLFGGAMEARALYGIKAELELKSGVKVQINRTLAMTDITGGYSDHTETKAPYKIIKLDEKTERHSRPGNHLIFKILSRLIIKDIAFAVRNREKFGF